MLKKIKKIYCEEPNEPFLGSDSLICKLTAFWIAMPLLRLMQKLKLKIHPNTISFASLFFILLAAFFFFDGYLLYGAISYFIYFLGDVLDGKWARLTKKTSALGAKLDYFICLIGNFAMFSGLWYSQFYLYNNWFTGLVLIFSYYVLVVLLELFVQDQNYTTVFPKVTSYYSPQEEGFAIFFIAPLFNILFFIFPLLVILQLLSLIALIIKQKERPNVKERLFKKLLKL